MKYPLISTLDYYKGRFLLFCSRFNGVNCNNELQPDFLRKCLEWTSKKSQFEMIRVAVIVNGVDDGSVGSVDDLEKISIVRAGVENLSNPLFYDSFDCIVFHGLSNNISPLIRSGIISYVRFGGGVLFSDVFDTTGSVSIFEDISSVVVVDSGVNVSSDRFFWTEYGLSHYLYENSLFGFQIPIVNTVSFYALGDAWKVLGVYDSEYSEQVYSDDDDDENSYSSNGYDIPGACCMVYFSSVYKNGAFDAEQ